MSFYIPQKQLEHVPPWPYELNPDHPAVNRYLRNLWVMSAAGARDLVTGDTVSATGGEVQPGPYGMGYNNPTDGNRIIVAAPAAQTWPYSLVVCGVPDVHASYAGLFASAETLGGGIIFESTNNRMASVWDGLGYDAGTYPPITLGEFGYYGTDFYYDGVTNIKHDRWVYQDGVGYSTGTADAGGGADTDNTTLAIGRWNNDTRTAHGQWYWAGVWTWPAGVQTSTAWMTYEMRQAIFDPESRWTMFRSSPGRTLFLPVSAVGGGLSIPVAMHHYARLRA